ncbi:Uncharacterised protein [Cedecea neteri]|uniref:Uncharacterized protein n=1 Tax=Cedecea neteri TaxID=158822 RepID=A0A291E667_9ENTR|nr:hypothetical protein [Cedecea neteri]ATF95433.1 hypothetical protein CO704_25480 [Cedecea neteri]SQC92148.1 Uncharacterised protein [Cedecea neteri]
MENSIQILDAAISKLRLIRTSGECFDCVVNISGKNEKTEKIESHFASAFSISSQGQSELFNLLYTASQEGKKLDSVLLRAEVSSPDVWELDEFVIKGK